MKFLTTSLVLVCLSLSAWAQQKPQLYNLPTPFERYSHYNLTVRGGAAIPMGAFSSDYIDKTTLRNYSVALDWILQKPFSIGLEVGTITYKPYLGKDMVLEMKHKGAPVKPGAKIMKTSNIIISAKRPLFFKI